MITKTLALKKNGETVTFDPFNRDNSGGVFLLLEDLESKELTLVLDESGREHHEDLFSGHPIDLRSQKVLGGGRYRQNSIKTYSFTRKWEIDWESGKYGDIDNAELRKEIAKTITNNEQKQLLD